MKNKFKKFFSITIVLFLSLLINTSCSAAVVKIVLTGGCCGGKTTSMHHLKKHFESKGYNVACLGEASTTLYYEDHISAKDVPLYDYERMVIKKQISEEDKICHGLEQNSQGKISLLFCDRAVLDFKGFMDDPNCDKLLKELGLPEEELYKRYSAVFHMLSTTKFREDLYSNDEVRIIDIDAARAVDDKLIKVWSKHPYWRLIENCITFDEKLGRLILEVEYFLSGTV